MIPPLRRPATPDGLFVWVMHRFADVFEDRAILKGGIALRLLDCPRSTTDIDYVFVPYRSKKDVLKRIETVLRELDDGEVSVTLHSRMLRATLRVDSAAIQVEASVDRKCPAMPIPTASLAEAQGQPSRIVRIMALDRALAGKLAAWNERRLLRDLYDCYYLGSRLGQTPDFEVLDARLGKVESRLPRLRKRVSMTRAELASELRAAVEELSEDALRDELAPILPAAELVGLVPRLRAALIRLVELLEHGGEPA